MDGQEALTGLEGFMKGWQFGSSILREREDKADRQSDRQQKKIEQGRATERFGREQKQWADQDVDRADMLAKRETPGEVIAARGRKTRMDEIGLSAAERGERQAPTDAEVAEERRLGLEGKRENIAASRANRALASRQEDRLSRKEGMDEEANRLVAMFDYMSRNKDLLNPEKMAPIERAYRAFALDDMQQMKPGDIDAAGDVMVQMFDTRQEIDGMPIAERKTRVLQGKNGKYTLQSSYKLQKPDGTLVDYEAPASKKGPDGVDYVREFDDEEAMRLLAGHELIGRGVKQMTDMGVTDVGAAIEELRSQYLTRTGAAGVQTLQRLDGVPESVEQVRVPLAKGLDVAVQVETNRPVTDASPIVGGVVEDPNTGRLVPAATLGDAKRVLGVQGAAPAADGPVTVSSQQEVAALPKGTKFVFNGKEYVKK